MIYHIVSGDEHDRTTVGLVEVDAPLDLGSLFKEYEAELCEGLGPRPMGNGLRPWIAARWERFTTLAASYGYTHDMSGAYYLVFVEWLIREKSCRRVAVVEFNVSPE